MKKNERFIIAVGASTGGPAHILAIVKALNRIEHATLIIIQHLDATYFHGFCHWLEKESEKKISLIKEGDICQQGSIYIAAANGHISIDTSNHFHLSPIDPKELYLPNIDKTFLNFADSINHGAAFLLTGMGEDGAKGLSVLESKKWFTAVQSPETCAVAGMPTAALAICKNHRILNPESVVQWIVRKEQLLGVDNGK